MAGSWSTIENRSNAAKGGRNLAMFSVAASFTADASAATIPNLALSEIDGAILTDVGVVFDGTTAPNSLTITALDMDGLTAWTGTFTASGRLSCSSRPSIVGGVTLAFSGNETNSAKAKVIAYFISNLR